MGESNPRPTDYESVALPAEHVVTLFLLDEIGDLSHICPTVFGAIMELMEAVKASNIGRNVKIRCNAGWLYLEYGVPRRKQYLHLRLSGTDALRCAQRMRDEFEQRLMLDIAICDLKFDDAYTRELVHLNKKNAHEHRLAAKRFQRMFGSLWLSDIGESHARRFRDSLISVTANTRNHYIGYLRHLWNLFISSGYVQKNPFSYIRRERVYTKREFLDIDELHLVEQAFLCDPVGRAFLFSCYTGLRLGDIRKLTPLQIENGYLSYTQSKTKSPERIRLPNCALKLAIVTEPVCFPIPAYKTLRKRLQGLCAANGIHKHITFHCARHTFATLQITLGTDIYTVSKLLGHASVATTQIYAKLIDKKKDEAMLLLDKITNSIIAH